MKKILCLSKRRPQQRDLVTSPYGRFFNLPLELSKLGHDVSLVLYSHRKDEEENGSYYNMRWHSLSVNPDPVSAYRKTRAIVRQLEPDWIIGFSDTYYGALAVTLANQFGAKSILDAYDNYTAYIQWAKPLHRIWFRAASKADIVTVAGPSLAELFREKTGREQVEILPMAADEVGFHFKDKFKARSLFKLPNDKFLFGFCGAISRTRGIQTLFDAYLKAKSVNPHIGLALSGRLDPDLEVPKDVYHLGFLPNEQLPNLLSALDVMVVTNKITEFGKYSYPIKLYEAMASGIGVIASETPSTKWILRQNPDCLVPPEDPAALAEKLLQFADMPALTFDSQPSWRTLAAQLNELIT